ncbi:response regulator [bacterium]|nr:response regulator [bacterium]
MIRLYLAEDHQLFAEGLMALLSVHKDIDFVGHASNGAMALREIEICQPDVCLVDINMPEMDGILLSEKLLEQNPKRKILILSTYSNPEFVRNLKSLGVKGYVLKSSGFEVLRKAILLLCEGAQWFEPEIEDLIHAQRIVPEENDRFMALSRRELEVLSLIGQGLTGNQMAEKLFLSTHTVETHRKNIQTKLGIRSTAALIKYANERGL